MTQLDNLAAGLPAQRHSVGDDDAVQDGFLRVARAGTDELTNPAGYWYVASRRARIDRQRREQREQRAARSWAHELAMNPCDEPPSEPISAEQVAGLHQAVGALQGRRRALVEAELAGVRSTVELAALLGMSPGAVRVLRHRTYGQLRRFLSSG